MRNDAALRNYLDTCLAFLKRNPTMRFYKPAPPLSPRHSSPSSPNLGTSVSSTPNPASFTQPTMNGQVPPGGDEPNMEHHTGETAIDHVVIIRKLTELHGLVKKRREVLHELESAHVLLAREVMAAVAARIRESSNTLTVKEKIVQYLPSRKKTKLQAKKREENLDMLVDALGSYLPTGSKELELWKTRRTKKEKDNNEGNVEEGEGNKTIWEVLAELPQETLDAFQPVTKLKFFRGQIAPSIDLYLTKLNLLTVSFERVSSVHTSL